MQIQGYELPICFATNKAYLQHFLVSLNSLLTFNPGKHAIYILHEDLDEESLSLIRNCAFKISEQTEIHSLKANSERLKHISGQEVRLGTAALLRLLLPDLLPKKYQVALYLDSDIIVQDELAFPRLPIDEYTLFAVKDPSSSIFAPKRNLAKMFNTGVLLLNLERWRTEGIRDKVLSAKPPLMRLADQELLNHVFNKKWFELPYAFNANALYLKRKGRFYYEANGNKPIVVHFMGMHKPWKYWTSGSSQYWKYTLQTPYRRNSLLAPVTVLNSVVWSIRYRLREIKKRFKKSTKTKQ